MRTGFKLTDKNLDPKDYEILADLSYPTEETVPGIIRTLKEGFIEEMVRSSLCTFINRRFTKTQKRHIRIFLREELEEMPLYLSHELRVIQEFATWRLKIGK